MSFCPKIAIVIPCYNEKKKYFKECIESAKSIDYENKDIFVLDDGSADKSIYDDYYNTPGVYIFTQTNKKLPQTLHNLFCLTKKYDYVSWGSSDNIWGEQFLKKHLEKMKEYNCDITYSSYYIIDEDSNFVEETEYRKHTNEQIKIDNKIIIKSTSLDSYEGKFKFIFGGDNFIGASFLIKNTVFENYLDLDGIEDYEFWMSAYAKKYKFKNIDTTECLYKYRYHKNSATFGALNTSDINYDRKFIMLKKHLFFLFIAKITEWNIDNINRYSSKYLCDFLHDFIGIDSNGLYDKDSIFINFYFKLINVFGCPNIKTVTQYDLDNLSTIKKISPLLKIENRNDIIEDIFCKKLICEFDIPNVLMKKKIKVLILTQKYVFGGLENIMEINSKYCSENFIINVGSFENSINNDIMSFNSDIKNLHKYIIDNNIEIVDLHYTLFELSEIHGCCKIVYTNHNSYFWLDKKKRDVIKRNDKYIDAYVNVSENVKNTSVNLFGNTEKKSFVIRNGIVLEKLCCENLEEFREMNNFFVFDTIILCTASILPDKGQYELVEAFHSFQKVQPNSLLILLGKIADENYFKKINKFIKENNIIKNVIHCQCPHEKVVYYTKIADICVLTSYVEGCSQSVKEWIFNNKKIILTNVGSNEKLAREFNNIKIIDVPYTIDEINTQEKYFNFLFIKNKKDFVDSITDALLKTTEKKIIENRNFKKISHIEMNKKKELLYYCIINNLNLVLDIFN